MTDNYLSQTSNGIETPLFQWLSSERLLSPNYWFFDNHRKRFFLFLMDSAKFILQSAKD